MATIIGTPKKNKLTGTSASDTMFGRGGNDLLIGKAGADKLYGEAGNDILQGGAGKDKLYGGAGKDILEGGKDADLLNGGGGSDWATYEHATGQVSASLNGVRGLPGGTSLGEARGDTYSSIENLKGTKFNDDLYGNGSANILDGGAGGDALFGRGGADTIITGSNGTDGDVVVYFDPSEGGDRILDFSSGDNFVLKGNGFNNGLELLGGTPDMPATLTDGLNFWKGSDPVAQGIGGQFLYDTDSGILSWDADGGVGSGPIVVIATLTNLYNLQATDFLVINL